MAHFDDPGTLQQMVAASALPTLEALGANEALLARERRRFDRDEPPPYTSSTEEESDTDPEHFTDFEIQKIIDEPLSKAELHELASSAIEEYCPGKRMWTEYHAESEYLKWHHDVSGTDPPLSYLLKYQIHLQRLHILARSAVRKRWQALGMWHDNGGVADCDGKKINIPGRNCAADDDGSPWEWEWATEDLPHDESHPAYRAVLLREGLRRGELPLPPPRSTPSSSSSSSQRDSYVTSRPWFQYLVSLNEENIRLCRLDGLQLEKAGLDAPSLDALVRKQWEKNGLWTQKWTKHRTKDKVGWKWPHESPSPEPEDYVQYDPDALEERLSSVELEEYERIGPKSPGTPPVEFFPWWYHDKAKKKQEEERLKRERKSRGPPPRYRKTAPKAKTTEKKAMLSAEPTRRSSRVPAIQEKKRKELAEKEEKEEQERRASEAKAVAAAAAKEKAKKSKTTVKGARPADQGATTARKGARTAAKNKKTLAEGAQAAAKDERTTANGNKTVPPRAKAAAKGTKKPPARGTKAATAKGTARTATKDTTTTAQRVMAALPATRKTLARGTKTAAKGAKTATKDTTAPSQDTKTPAQGTKRKRK